MLESYESYGYSKVVDQYTQWKKLLEYLHFKSIQ